MIPGATSAPAVPPEAYWGFSYLHTAAVQMCNEKKKGESKPRESKTSAWILPPFSVNRLEPLRFIWLRDRGWRSHRGGFREGFRTPLASLCWVRRLAGWYMTYILPTDAIFVRAPAWKLVWVANKCRLCPPTLQSTCTLHKWQSLVCYSDFWIQSADAPSACQAIFSWAGILAAV